jgi:hypothetical protein
MKAEQQELPPSPGDRSIPMPFSYKLLSPHRQFGCRSFALADIRFISKKLGYTINDVFISCVSGALRRYLAERGEPVDKPTLSSIPMNLVPLQELQAIAQDEDTRISLANASRSTGD